MSTLSWNSLRISVGLFMLLLVLLTTNGITSKSDVSPNEDFFSFPQFESVFKDTPVPPPKNQEDVFFLPSGGSFACEMPSLDLEDTHEQVSDELKNRPQSEILENALKLLEPMKSGCLKVHHEWWTYDFCYQNHVKQFHMAGNTVYLNYVLGRYFKTKSIANLESFGRFRYLTVDYISGTQCDVTKQPRTVKIRFQCALNSTDLIESVKESSTCQYVMTIRTPRLCQDPYFLTSEKILTKRIIHCHPILSEQAYSEWNKGQPLPSPPPMVEMPKHSPLKHPFLPMPNTIARPIHDLAVELLQGYIGTSKSKKQSKNAKVVVIGQNGQVYDSNAFLKVESHSEEDEKNVGMLEDDGKEDIKVEQEEEEEEVEGKEGEGEEDLDQRPSDKRKSGGSKKKRKFRILL